MPFLREQRNGDGLSNGNGRIFFDSTTTSSTRNCQQFVPKLFTSTNFRCKLKFIAIHCSAAIIFAFVLSLCWPSSSTTRMCKQIAKSFFHFHLFRKYIKGPEGGVRNEHHWTRGGRTTPKQLPPLIKTLSRPLHCVIALVVFADLHSTADFSNRIPASQP